MAYKTPGVYVQEIALFPPSVAEVATAIPAFIGYTQNTTSSSGRNLVNVPVRISSLVEYQNIFGADYIQKGYTITVKGKQITGIVPDKRFMLYPSVRQYFDNGGGPCYIVTAGDYSSTIDVTAMGAALDALQAYDEPTLILFPDAVSLLKAGNPDLDSFSQLQEQALTQCAKLQDRFCIFDLLNGYKAEDSANNIDPIGDFRDKIGINNLNYGAAYYPWIVTSYDITIDFGLLSFLDGNNANAPIPPANFNVNFSKDNNENALVTNLQSSIANTGKIAQEVVSPEIDPAKLSANGVSEITAALKKHTDLIPQNKPAPNDPVSQLIAYMNLLAAVAAAFPKADADLGATALKGDISKLKNNTKLVNALTNLVAVENNDDVKTIMTGRDPSTQYTQFASNSPWLGGKSFSTVTKTATSYKDPNVIVNITNILNDLSDTVNTILISFSNLQNAASFYESQAEQALFAGHTFFGGVEQAITTLMQTIPPSGAIAGVYAAVDAARGVWKAPANVSLNNVTGPSVKIDNSDQDDMNVTSSGKSINAIRAFTGKGTLVWGARTLAGNDNEWRYIPVRRFFIMVEESVKDATYPFVFEDNDAGTWTKVRMMIQNFLTLQWRAGALQGAKPEDAFFVHVGLGETMTADDILNGLLIVEIGMAAVRPAEFIILRFMHKMQES